MTKRIVAWRYRVKHHPQGWEYSTTPLFSEESGPGPEEEYEALNADELVSELNHREAVRIPEFDDAAVSAVNRLISELTGVKHLGVTGKIMNAVRDELIKGIPQSAPISDSAPASERPIECYERMPSTDDADEAGMVWGWNGEDWILTRFNSSGFEIGLFTRWLPTGLTKPTPSEATPG